MDASLPKSERLCGLKAVGELFQTGKSASAGCLRCKYRLREGEQQASRMLVSVPKRSFKRAVKRNLLKRRIRESYRRQKALLGPGVDVLFIYTLPEMLPYELIYADMTTLLTQISHASGR